MHIHSHGQPQVWTGADGTFTRKQPVSNAFKSSDTAGAGTVTKGPFTDVLNSAISSPGIKGSAFDASVQEQLNLVEIEPVSRQYASGGMQTMTSQPSRCNDGADGNLTTSRATPTDAASTGTAFSTKGNLVNFFA